MFLDSLKKETEDRNNNKKDFFFFLNWSFKILPSKTRNVKGKMMQTGWLMQTETKEHVQDA